MMGNQNVLSEGSYPSLVTLCFSSVLVYALITACYRLYFHPLASFPGPFWARLTVIPSWWHTRTGDRHIWMHSLQEKYGPEFRYRPDSVVLNTPSAFRKIFGPKGNIKKSDYYRIWPRNVHSINTWSSTTIDVHARKRRVLNYAFSEAALRDAEVFLHSNMDRWLELIGQQATKDGEWTTPINMCDWINWLVFDILGDLCFGKNFNMKEPESDLRHIPEVMATYLEMMHAIAFSPFADIWLWLKPRGLDWLLSVATPPVVQRWQDFVSQCLTSRSRDEQELEKNPKPESEVRRDFFHWLFKAVDPETGERGYDLNELYAECELLTIAGSDTTSVVMSAAFFYLAKQPAVQAKLAQEIRSTFASYSDIKSGSKITSCKYMTAFLQEAMRMTPPLAAEPSRQVLPGGTSVDNHYFPAGVHVSTGLYCLSYNENVYPQPFKFRPERWIVDESGKDGSSAESVALAETGFCAFSFGTRGCVGKNLAWLEMRLVLAKTLWMYEVQGVPGNNLGGGDPKAQPGRQVEDQYQLYDMFVANRKGPVVQMRKRQC